MPGTSPGMTAELSGGSVFPHQADQLALDLHPVGAEDAGLVGLVGGFEGDRIALAAQALQRHFVVVDQRHHDRAVLGILAALDQHGKGLYEPIHGSAPDIAGQGKANPCAAILSAAMMLRHTLGMTEPADRIEAAVAAVLASGKRPGDLGGDCTTGAMGDAILAAL